MRPRSSFQTVLASVLLLNSCALFSRPSQAPMVRSAELNELSGLAFSRGNPDLLWGHNDSGDRARLFRIGANDGADLGNLDLPGATAVDWEDIAAFTWKGKPALLIGDIGDNNAQRDHLTLYAVRDPGADGEALELLWKLDFRYPDGARDCESIAVDPVAKEIILLSKRDHPQHLYRIPLPTTAPEAGVITTAEALGPVDTLPRATLADLVEHPLYSQFDGPTAMDIAPSGSVAVVMTYHNAYLYRRDKGEGWRQAFDRTPEIVRLPKLKQGEAAAISADGTSLIVSGEGRHPPLVTVALPAAPPPLNPGP